MGGGRICGGGPPPRGSDRKAPGGGPCMLGGGWPRIVDAGPVRYACARLEAEAGPRGGGAVDAIPGPMGRGLDVPFPLLRWIGPGFGRVDAGPPDVEAGGSDAAAFFSAA